MLRDTSSLHFGDDEGDLVDFRVQSFHLDMPEFDVYVGHAPIKHRLPVPCFALASSHIKHSAGRLDRRTGDFTLKLELEITEREVPALGLVRNLGVMRRFDMSTVKATLFETGHLSLRTNHLRAHGRLFVGDAGWRRPADSYLTAGSLQCDTSGTLQASIGIDRAAGQDYLVLCPNTPFSLLYSTTKAKSASISGSGVASAFNVPSLSPLSSGIVPVKQKAPGEGDYTMHVSGSDCEFDTGSVKVFTVGPDTPYGIGAVFQPLDDVRRQGWVLTIPAGAVDPKVRVRSIQLDSPIPLDSHNAPIASWSCSFTEANGVSHGFTAGKTEQAVPNNPGLAGQWEFSSMTQKVDPSKQAPSDYSVVGFKLRLAC